MVAKTTKAALIKLDYVPKTNKHQPRFDDEKPFETLGIWDVADVITYVNLGLYKKKKLHFNSNDKLRDSSQLLPGWRRFPWI